MIPSRALACCVLVISTIAGCREPPGTTKVPVSQPQTTHTDTVDSPAPKPTTMTAPRPDDQSDQASPHRVVVMVRDPAEPQRGWLIIEEMVKSGGPASAIGTIAGPRKLVVVTKNVKALRIELPKAGMPSDRRVVLRIDNQGIEITGRRGPTARFQRSKQGAWSARRK